MAEPINMKLGMYVMPTGYLNGVLYKSVPSVIPTLTPIKLYCFIDYITRTYTPKSFFYSYQIFKLQWKERGEQFFPEHP
jgi:hypothetical protein